MDKYKNKYRIASARAQWWDYGWNGAYFITICTKNREHFFGEIVDGMMELSHLGVMADILWHEIPNHDPFVELGDFVVMPNHIHGILILEKPVGGVRNDGLDDGLDDAVETLHATSLPPILPPSPSPRSIEQSSKSQTQNEKMAEISPKSNSVSTIIRSYKSALTKHANRLGFENGWQPRFHDHIIRNDAEYQRISNYIITNPFNWKDDKFYTS